MTTGAGVVQARVLKAGSVLIVIIIILVVIAWLLWHVLNVQAVRAQVDVHRETAAACERVVGTEADARRDGRLIEYLSGVARFYGGGVGDVREYLSERPDAEREVILESFMRGKRLDWLEPDHYVHLHDGFPGPKPERKAYCDAMCDDFREVMWLPPDASTCPFCGSAVEHRDEERPPKWERDMEAWQRFRALFPDEAQWAEREELDRRREHEDELKAGFETRMDHIEHMKEHEARRVQSLAMLASLEAQLHDEPASEEEAFDEEHARQPLDPPAPPPSSGADADVDLQALRAALEELKAALRGDSRLKPTKRAQSQPSGGKGQRTKKKRPRRT